MRIIRPNYLLILLVVLLGFRIADIRAEPALQHGYVELPGVRLHYLDSGGEGVPVIFLHAGTGSTRVWENQIPAFTAAGYRFIAYDRRGWGESIIDPAGPQPGNSADDLLGLADHLGLDRFHLIGFAAGGSVAWDAVLTYPERIRSLVIANNAGRIDEPDYRNFVSSLRPRKFGELPVEFRELSPAYRAANPEGTRRWLALELSSRSREAQIELQPLKNRLTFKLLEQVKTPVLLMAGGADLTAPAPLLQFFTEHIRHAETLIVPDAGHSIYWEQPEVFNKAVIDFISQH